MSPQWKTHIKFIPITQIQWKVKYCNHYVINVVIDCTFHPIQTAQRTVLVRGRGRWPTSLQSAVSFVDTTEMRWVTGLRYHEHAAPLPSDNKPPNPNQANLDKEFWNTLGYRCIRCQQDLYSDWTIIENLIAISKTLYFVLLYEYPDRYY